MKLSREFYERLGNDVANELVEWFNSVDATYRGDLRELNELNFARFDAKLEQRLAQLEAKLEVEFEQRLAHTKTSILAWSFTFWITTLLAIFGSRLIR